MTNENNNAEKPNPEDIISAAEKPEDVNAPPPPAYVMVTEDELERLKKDASEYKDKYLRLLAELENTRKRLQKDGQELSQYAVKNVIVDFLNPIDHMENAINFAQQMSDEVKNWAFGFQMVLNQFKDVLASNGVVPFKAEGMQFDPHSHEAVEMVETNEYPEGAVVSESLRGYKMGDKVIRPARVRVAKTFAPPSQEEQKQENNKS